MWCSGQGRTGVGGSAWKSPCSLFVLERQEKINWVWERTFCFVLLWPRSSRRDLVEFSPPSRAFFAPFCQQHPVRPQLGTTCELLGSAALFRPRIDRCRKAPVRTTVTDKSQHLPSAVSQATQVSSRSRCSCSRPYCLRGHFS